MFKKNKKNINGNTLVRLLGNDDGYFREVEVTGSILDSYKKSGENFHDQLKKAIKSVEDFIGKYPDFGTIWHINSTAYGGGVAEMIPDHILLLRGFGFKVRWLVFQPKNDDFFDFTKKIHNSFHDVLFDISEEALSLYDVESSNGSLEIGGFIKKGDLIICHDPQPLGAVNKFLEGSHIPAIWRCHIGFPYVTEQIKKTWNFINSYLYNFDHIVLSDENYFSDSMLPTSYISPSINPFSIKNTEYNINDLAFFDLDDFVEIVSFSGEKKTLHDILNERYILQISRWDRLKGFDTLIDSYLNFHDTFKSENIPRLILSGPDATGVSDDPEAFYYYNEIIDSIKLLPLDISKNIIVVNLSMRDPIKNAILTSVIQSNAEIICQLSKAEGFGLTLTEAMFKGRNIIISSAFGLVKQVDNGVSGLIAYGPEIENDVANHLNTILSDENKVNFGNNARKSILDNSIQISKIPCWVDVIERTIKGN